MNMFFNTPGEWDEYEDKLTEEEKQHDTVQSDASTDGDDTEGSEE